MNFKETEGGLLVPDHKLLVGGIFRGQIIRDGEVIDEFEDHNIVVNEGLNYLINTGLAGQGAQSSWYIGLFSGNYTPLATDTAANIATHATEWTGYSESTRQPFTTSVTSTQSISNSGSTANFTQNSAGTIYGAFVISNSAKNGSTGVLLAAAQFATSKTVAVGDILALTYTVGASSS